MGIKSKAQSWSIDIALGVAVFVAAFFIFYSLLNANPAAKVNNLKEEASNVVRQATAENGAINIINGNELNISKAVHLKNTDYDELKRALRVEGDFCIYLEDEKGNIVLINNSYKGIGSPSINLSGVPCN